jgi:hypothetical protein
MATISKHLTDRSPVSPAMWIGLISCIVALMPSNAVAAETFTLSDQAKDTQPEEGAAGRSTDFDPFISEPVDTPPLNDSFSSGRDARVRPPVLRLTTDDPLTLPPEEEPLDGTNPLLVYPRMAPLGFSGPSSVMPTERQSTSHFVPTEDRWRQGMPGQDRYGKGHPLMDDYPGVKGAWWDPYNQNVLKGDYPIFGQHTFLKLTGKSLNLFEGIQTPTPTTPFEATRNPGATGFFGNPDQFLLLSFNSLALDLFHGNAAFKQEDWRVHLELNYNMNYLGVNELGVVGPDVRDGTSRYRQYITPEQWYLETKLMDTSPYYDFVSTRVGSQPFNSDFRGLIFNDVNRGVRLFGTRHANRDQYNVMWFDQTEKDTNSTLNRLTEDRGQNTWILNYYRQDFLVPGHDATVSFHANRDEADFEIDKNGFLARPDGVGVFQPHEVNSYYIGGATNGHIERFNVSSALYHVFGDDSLNPLAGRSQKIAAWLAAFELSYDRDWVRFRTSYLYASGDDNPDDGRATGFDAIFPDPNFAGAEFSYFGRQAIRLFGVELTNRLSLTPSMRSSKFQGQTNFVNPGLHLFNLGMDADITPRLKLIHNTNFLWFDKTQPLETYLFADEIDDFIGTDISLGAEYRPLLNNNILFLGGLATLISGDGFKDLYQRFDGKTQNHVAGFVEVVLEF